MNFRSVIEKLLAAFADEGIAYGLIGGYAVSLWGVQRGTVDIDFLVPRDDMPKVHRIMASMGYDIKFSSQNVTQFSSPLGTLGEIDYLHAFRSPSLAMLTRAVEKKLFEKLTVRILIPEDLIGLKVQAIANDKSRESLDMYDVETLMKLHGSVLDWELIAEYFEIFEELPLFAELQEKYRADK
jgi:hypothetical protein